jgi:hypothetical protein
LDLFGRLQAFLWSGAIAGKNYQGLSWGLEPMIGAIAARAALSEEMLE